jgi:hypothetical protein
MKTALYYSVRTMCLYPHVVAVTSEKGRSWGRHCRWYGRDVRYNEATNGTTDQLKGRFATQEEAQAQVDNIKRIEAEHKAMRQPLEAQLVEIGRAERRAIDSLFKSADE